MGVDEAVRLYYEKEAANDILLRDVAKLTTLINLMTLGELEEYRRRTKRNR